MSTGVTGCPVDERESIPRADSPVAHADDETRQAVDDWVYWVDRGYRF